MNAGNLFNVGEMVVVNKDSLRFKARVIGAVKKQFWPSKYTLELSNGERLVAEESELSPHVVSKYLHAINYITTLLLAIAIIVLLAQI